MNLPTPQKDRLEMNESFGMLDDNDPVVEAMTYAECQTARDALIRHGDDLIMAMMETPPSDSARFATANGL